MNYVNNIGLEEIRQFLLENHKFGPDYEWSHEQLCAWAQKAEFQLGEGNPPCIEIRSFDSVSGHEEEFRISEAGLDEEKTETVYLSTDCENWLICRLGKWAAGTRGSGHHLGGWYDSPTEAGNAVGFSEEVIDDVMLADPDEQPYE